MSKLGDLIDIPKNCEIDKTIFKKLFFENANMNRSDRDFFTKHIDKIKWDYSLKTDNTNIKPYKDEIKEYNEVEFITVKLKSPKKTKRIAKIIMRTIPYPMVLTFENSNKIRLFTGHLRTNLADSSKNTIDEFIFTGWIDLDNLDETDIAFLEDLQLKNLNFSNFYSLYSCIIENIICYNVSKISHITADLNVYEMKDIYDQITDINNKIELIKRKMKKETQFKNNVEMNMKIKRLKDKKEELKGRLI